MKFRHGDFIKHPDYPKRIWAVLEVSQERFNNTDIDVEKPGLYAFGGFWYGTDRLSIDSYGKVMPLSSKFTLYENPNFEEEKD